ncbi:MAG: undecaprenyldiphospho-muramoylpentapeptide beta-N-acetylglucosaminyltransferase [Candidatus Eremiobacteraeota bacterium]|nr:undecaprenyldiphospho-muramoylpentapeptide beta-N-acetylglucosaminyltransferase [Candidatus Eremiobacteraeota bacterium]
MNLTFTGGGTGGHLYPAIAIADALARRANIRFIGASDRLEAKIVPAAGYEVDFVPSRPLVRGASFKAVVTLAVNACGVLAAIRLLVRRKPDLLIASGGYVCFPVVVAARFLRFARVLRCPIALLEINARPGLTNRLLAPLVDEVWGAFASAQAAFAGKYVQTGIPVRASLRALPDRADAARWLGLDPARRTILVMGGSQGARSINEAVAALVTRRALPNDWQILHVSGERDFEYMKAEQREPFGTNKIVLVPYLNDLAEAYAVSDLVVGRAGASTLGELAALGIPSILIPYPFAADDHQNVNARAFADAGAAVILDDEKLDGDLLWWTLRAIFEPVGYERMRAAARSLAPHDALEAILRRIDERLPA